MARLRAGFCRVANPYGGPPSTVALGAGEVDGFVFWTRNIAPLAPDLDEIRARAPFIVQFTATAYPRALESSVIAPERAVAQIRELAARFGPRAVVWRYDPVLVTSLTPPEWHRETVARLADALAGAIDEVVLSVANIYRKTRRNLDRAASRHGFDWRAPDGEEEKRELLAALGGIAAERGIRPTLCSQPELLVPPLGEARCIDVARFGDIAGWPFSNREKGNRVGCRCAESRDIGAYDTCPHGCVYCYAVTSRDRAARAYRDHELGGEFLGGRRSADLI
ncbi:MAG TPA: DUF1848 domain-containing protein, partial [Stellaceae bacterium]